MTPDAVWITSSGQKLVGRAEIERAHVAGFKEDAATGGSTHAHPPETIVIRFLRPDIAVADLDSLFISNTRPDGKPVPPQRSGLFIVVTKTAGTWLIAEVRNILQPRS